MPIKFDAILGTLREEFSPTNTILYTRDPNVNDDITQGFVVFSQWLNSSTGVIFTCSNNSAGAAIWKKQETGLQPKSACIATTTANINLNETTIEVDGFSLSEFDRVLVKDQNDPKTNGIYNSSLTGNWNRTIDTDSDSEIANAYVFITSGDTQKNSAWVVQGAPSIGVDDVIFQLFSVQGEINAGDGLNKTGDIIKAVGTTDRILVNSLGINISPNYAGQNTITTLGTVAQGTWNATTIGINKGGTNATTVSGATRNLGLIYNNCLDVTTGQTINSNDRGKFYNTDCTLGNITHTLPLASVVGNGFIVSFRKSDATTNQVIIHNDNINGSATSNLTYQNQTLTLVSNGLSGWYIAQRGQKNPTPIGEGGTGADLSLSGGINHFVKQLSIGGNFSTGLLTTSELPSGINIIKLSSGIVSNTQFDCLSGITSDIQAQLNKPITVLALPSEITATKISNGVVSNSAFDTLSGVTSDIQAQLNKPITTAELPSNIPSTKIGTGNVSALEFESLSAVTGDIQTQLDRKIEATNNLLSVENVVIVKKNPGVGEFSSINSAIASVSAAAIPTVIWIGPGTYTEPELNLTENIYLVGEHQKSVIIQPNTANHNIINMSTNSEIYNLTIENAGTGYNGVYLQDAGNFALLHKVAFNNCDTAVYSKVTNIDSSLFFEYVDMTDCMKHSVKCETIGAYKNFCNFENLFMEYSSVNSSSAILLQGSGSECNIQGASLNGISTTGTAVIIDDGAYLNICNARMEDWDKAFYVTSTGTTPYLKAQAIDFDDNNYNIIVENDTAIGQFLGIAEYSKISINPNSSFFIANKDSNIITVAKSGGDFTTIKDALASITNNSTTNRYTISVGPGTFIEETLVMKPYTYIVGSVGKLATIISSNSANTYLIESSVNTAIVNTFLGDLNGTGKALIKYTGGILRVFDCRFRNCECVIDASGVNGSGSNNIWFSRISLGDLTIIKRFAKISDDDVHHLHCIFDNIDTIDCLNLLNFAEIQGVNTKVCVNASIFESKGALSGTFLTAFNGCILQLQGTSINNFENGLVIENTGAGPNIELNGITFNDNTQDIIISNPLTYGHIDVAASKSKINIDQNTNISINVSDRSDGSFIIAGSYYQGRDFNHLSNLTKMIMHSQIIGAYNVVNFASAISGTTIQIISGDGYVSVDNFPNDYTKYIQWNTQNITLSANTDNYIYVDENSIVNSSYGIPSIFKTIIIGKARTTSNGIAFFQKIDVDAWHNTLQLERMLRLGFGPIYSSGSITTPSSATLKLDVTNGTYYYGSHMYSPAGGNQITFNTWYNNGSSNWNILTGQNIVDVNYFDNRSGTLSAIPTSGFVKHALYIANDNAYETYNFIYGQEVFTSIIDAENGNNPTPPATWTSNIAQIASIIVQSAVSAIVEVIDQRPRPSFAAPSTTVITKHGDLQGLLNDDHTQYLLANGNRALAGDLNVNSNNIINAGTINSVTIESHQARHQPNGSDPLPTAAPTINLSYSTPNSAGIQVSLARSDHSHAITTYSENTANSIVARNSDGSFAATTVSANLIGLATSATFAISTVSSSFATSSTTSVSSTYSLNATNAISSTSSTTSVSSTYSLNATNAISSTSSTTSVSSTYSNNSVNSISAINFTGFLLGDVSGTQGANVVTSVGGSTNILIHSAELAANAATALNTNSAIVKRDSTGGFAATNVSSTFIGNLSGNISGIASNITGILAIVNGGTGATTSSGALINLGGITSSRKINTAYPLSGGSALSADLTLSINTVTTTQNGIMLSSDKAKLNNYLGTLTLDILGTATSGLFAYCSDALWSGGNGCLVVADGTTWRNPDMVPATSSTFILDRFMAGNLKNTDKAVTWFEDFIGGTTTTIPNWISTTSNGGAVSLIQTIDQNHPGNYQLATGTSNNSTGRSTIYMGAVTGTNALSFLLGASRFYFGSLIRLPVLATAGTSYIIRIGLGRNINYADFTNGVYFEYNRGTSNNWLIKTADNTSITTINSGIAVTELSWIKLECVIVDGTSATYYINGTEINAVNHPITTNIPATAGREVMPIIQLQKQAPNSTTSSLLQVDFWRMTQTFNTER
jgi:hypothetical protein